MHYPQLLFVEAKTQKQAMDAVAKGLRPYKNVFWDDYELAGDLLGLEPEDGLFRGIVYQDRMVQAIELATKYRLEQTYRARRLMRHLMEPVMAFEDGDPTIEEGNPSAVPFDDLAGHFMQKLGRAICRYYDSECGYFDVVTDTATTKHFYERLEADPVRQWLVLLDVHN